jgi:hypothetical protein
MPTSTVHDRLRIAGSESAEAAPRPAAEGHPGEVRPRGAGSVANPIVLGVLSTLVSVNLWTGGPLFALWVGSRIQAAVGQLSMAAVGATVAALIVETLVLYKVLLLRPLHPGGLRAGTRRPSRGYSCIALTVKNSSRPKRPSSRPWPDCL